MVHVNGKRNEGVSRNKQRGVLEGKAKHRWLNSSCPNFQTSQVPPKQNNLTHHSTTRSIVATSWSRVFFFIISILFFFFFFFTFIINRCIKTIRWHGLETKSTLRVGTSPGGFHPGVVQTHFLCPSDAKFRHIAPYFLYLGSPKEWRE